MGWNSWDAYGFTINEADFKANAAVLSKLKPLGWTYAVIDEGWYMGNLSGKTEQTRNYQLDAHGLLIPAASRFPSAADGTGFKPLADWVHAQGLKFGVHIVRGIPKQAVRDNGPINRAYVRAVWRINSCDNGILLGTEGGGPTATIVVNVLDGKVFVTPQGSGDDAEVKVATAAFQAMTPSQIADIVDQTKAVPPSKTQDPR